jgi:hypothetical membrane protein
METLPSAGARYPLTKPLLLTGVAAPILYALTVIWGATLFPGYSHLADPISSLTQAGREGTGGLESLFFIYNGLIIVYGITGISLSLGRRRWIWSFGLLIVTGLAGVLMWPFAQDPIGASISWMGIGHILLAAVESLASMGAIGAAALGYRAAGRRPMALFSLACLAVVFVSGLFAGIAIGAGWAHAGLLERVTIGTFELWIVVTGASFLGRALAAQPSAGASSPR